MKEMEVVTVKRTRTLSVKQEQAIQLAVEGYTWVQISETVGVSKETMWRWRQEAIFQASLIAAQEAIYSETALFHNTYVSNAFAVLHRIAVNKGDKYSPELEMQAAVKIIELTHRNIEVIKVVEQNRETMKQFLSDYEDLDKEIVDVEVKDVPS